MDGVQAERNCKAAERVGLFPRKQINIFSGREGSAPVFSICIASREDGPMEVDDWAMTDYRSNSPTPRYLEVARKLDLPWQKGAQWT
eukprot:3542793-Prymnesium_polylepis.1